MKVLHTPGHAANHLCLVLLEDGLLFSGDPILNGSTTVVDPPDGNMTTYLDSLDLLSTACNEHGIEFILPAPLADDDVDARIWPVAKRSLLAHVERIQSSKAL